MPDTSRHSQRAKAVLARANDESARLGHEYVGTEHLLLGLIGDTEGVAIAVLQNLGVDFARLRLLVETTVKRGTTANRALADRPLTSRTKRALELASTEAQALGHAYIGTEHLLLGLLGEARGIGAQILISTGVTADAARAEIVRLLSTPRQ